MHFAQLTEAEQRVFGCLIEKRWTTPEQYPLSLNALRLACNQSTNRDPVTHYDESEVRDAAQRLSKYGLARLASGHTSRAVKYRHLAEEALGLGRETLAVLCVLLLRGPQTPGELKQRSERMAPLASLADVERVLDELIAGGYAVRLERRPGHKEDRFMQLLGGGADSDAGSAPEASAPAAPPTPREPARTPTMAPPVPVGAYAPVASPDRVSPPAPAPGLVPAPAGTPVATPAPDPSDGELDALRDRVAALEADLARLREQLADLL